MPNVERVTVTLPGELVREMDRRERNRSRFVADAVRRELDRRRRDELRRSLAHPHPESTEGVDSSFKEWLSGLPDEDAEALVDQQAGKPVQWIPGQGWIEG